MPHTADTAAITVLADAAISFFCCWKGNMLYTSKALSIFNLQSATYKPDGQYLQGVNDEHCKVIV